MLPETVTLAGVLSLGHEVSSTVRLRLSEAEDREPGDPATPDTLLPLQGSPFRLPHTLAPRLSMA